MGRGVTVTKLAFRQARDSHVQKLEATQVELLSKLEDLHNVVRDLARKKKKCDCVSKSEVSDVSKGQIRCQLLDWYSDDEVVVGEGEFCSAEPMYKIGRIPLGPNAATVIVKSASNPDSCLEAYPNNLSLGQARGVKIAWPVNKVILDNDIDSPTRFKTAASSDTSLERIHIYYWNLDDEIIAEGLLCSTNPKELVNDISLGPNAAIMKIEVVVKHDAYLWRPSAEMSLMGDALNGNIAWPIHKIQLINLPTLEESAKRAPSVSNNSYSSKGAKKKCILLDCTNSGDRAAEGRVLSTDLADVVHFIPLGPNASKIWVEVSKIDGATVWRPNSEIEFISDGVDTTVAWPNDKIIFL